MKKQLLSEELLRMKRLSGIISEGEYQSKLEEAKNAKGNLKEGKWDNPEFNDDMWADIETGGEYSKSKERVKDKYWATRNPALGSELYRQIVSKVKSYGRRLKDADAIDFVEDVKKALSFEEVKDLYYHFKDENNVSSYFLELLKDYVETGPMLENEFNDGEDYEKMSRETEYGINPYSDTEETASIGKNYPDEIEGEYEGEPETLAGVGLYDLLYDIVEIAISEDDFIKKVTQAVTDETSSLSAEDEQKLRNWYKRNA